MKPKNERSAGAFTLVDFMVVMAVLAVLAVMLVPALKRSRAKGSRVSCANLLKQAGLASRQWAIDNGDKFPAHVSVTNGGAMELVESGGTYAVFLVMSNELNTPKILICPADRTPSRIMATSFSFESSQTLAIPFTNNNNISYFVGLDANETQPNAILSGDDNFLVNAAKPKPGVLLLWTNSPVAWTKDRHVNQGYIGLADGSVMGVGTPKLGEALVNTGMATNRLAMP